MGGRGASSGLSVAENVYGTQYREILREGNIKFISKNARNSETLMETMTKGRVYVTVGGNDLLQVTYFDSQNKRSKTIDFTHLHAGLKPHTHHGYLHNENDSVKGAANLTAKEKKMVDKILEIWHNYLSRK